MNVDQYTFCDLVITVTERQVLDRLQDSIASAVEEMFMEVIKLGIDSVASQKKSPSNVLTDVLISRIIRSGNMECYLETLLSSLADSILSTDFIPRRIINERNFVTPVAQILKIL